MRHAAWPASFPSPASQPPCGLRLAPRRPPGRAEAGAGTVDGPLQSSCTALPLSIAQAGLPAASARQHVSLVCVGTLFLFSLFLAETTQALARSPKQPLGSLPVPSLAMPSETYICCTLTPPCPSHGPSGPPTVTLPPSLSIWPSHLTPQFDCLLLPPHTAHLLDFSWAAVPTLHDV